MRNPIPPVLFPAASRPRAPFADDEPQEQSERTGHEGGQENGRLQQAREALGIGIARDPQPGENVSEIVDPADRGATIAGEYAANPFDTGLAGASPPTASNVPVNMPIKPTL